jgi:hypothetical protein
VFKKTKSLCVFLNADYLFCATRKCLKTQEALKLIAKNDFVADGGKIYIESEFKITLDFLTENLPKKVKINKQKK